MTSLYHITHDIYIYTYETDYEGVPCLIEVVCDESLGLPAPPQVAAFVSSVCTLQQLVSAINALWIFELVGVSLTVSDGVLTYDSDDRFRPRVGAFFSIHVRPEAPDGSSLLQVSQSLFMPGGMPEQKDLKVVPATAPFLNRFKKASNLQDPRPSRAPGLASAGSGPSRPSAPVEPEPEDDDTPGDDDPDDDPDEDPEDAALSDDIPHHTAFVYHLQDDFFAFEVDEISSDTTLEQISDGWGLQYRELAALHTVNSPPSDHLDPGTETVIAELAQDADVRPLEADILSLVDVEFRPPLGTEVYHIRKVLWMRSTSTRVGVLHQLKAFDRYLPRRDGSTRCCYRPS